jgi:photosystem II stability/assembly factor-like uncharacterized protein
MGLRGTALSSVSARGSTIEVLTASGAVLRSTDKGAHFIQVTAASLPPVTVTSDNYQWSVSASGEVQRRSGDAMPVRDPGSPELGAGAHLLTAPAAVPGVVIAVGRDGTVWRRAHDGGWRRALLLLPQNLVQGAPPVTSITAFAQPLSSAVYLGTAGYSVLVSSDGGDDWIRAGPGLPDRVYGLYADSGARAVYAATSDGLWVHTLRSLPAPPRYSDQALVFRWLGIGAATLVAAVLAVVALMRLLPASERRST